MDNKKTVIIVVSIISATLVVLALIFAFVFFGSVSLVKKNMSKPEIDPNVSVNTQDQVEILPEIERDTDEEYDGKDPFTDNILDGAKLADVFDTYGYKSAVLVTATKSYTLYEGDTVGDSDWVVSEITDNSITLVSGDKTLTFTKQ